ncbi:MAG: hypothetical protein ACXWC9_04260 [Pseudobdellovibrionaceae bacterium]
MRKIFFLNVLALTLAVNALAADPIEELHKTYLRLAELALGSAMDERIAEIKKLAEPPDKVARNIKGKLDIYKDAVPMKIIANDICSAQGPKLNAYYKDEVFSFTEIQDPISKNTHTTQIRYKKSLAQEKEDFVQVYSYREPRHGTYTYELGDGYKVTPLTEVKTSIRMIDQFVSSQVLPQQTSKRKIENKEHATLKLELHKAWELFKEAGACCALDKCKKDLVAQMASSITPHNRPNSSQQGSAGTP